MTKTIRKQDCNKATIRPHPFVNEEGLNLLKVVENTKQENTKLKEQLLHLEGDLIDTLSREHKTTQRLKKENNTLLAIVDTLVLAAKQLTVARVNQGEERSALVMECVEKYETWVFETATGVKSV